MIGSGVLGWNDATVAGEGVEVRIPVGVLDLFDSTVDALSCCCKKSVTVA